MVSMNLNGRGKLDDKLGLNLVSFSGKSTESCVAGKFVYQAPVPGLIVTAFYLRIADHLGGVMDNLNRPQLPGERRGILVVEDNEADFTLLKRELERLNIRAVSSAGSKKEVNELLAGKTKEARLPAVMFVDISLPDGDARDCLEEWRKKLGKGTLIVLTTGSLRGEDLQTLYQRGADTFLAKPISGGDLEHLTVFYGRFFTGSDRF